jgi:hypothetical protein
MLEDVEANEQARIDAHLAGASEQGVKARAVRSPTARAGLESPPMLLSETFT